VFLAFDPVCVATFGRALLFFLETHFSVGVKLFLISFPSRPSIFTSLRSLTNVQPTDYSLE